MTRAGAPVSYGGFLSNVDMKSGSLAFGTPEHVRACIRSSQLARHIGLPWRSATGAASNTADAQGAAETIMALWDALLGNATVTVHAAGWTEAGALTADQRATAIWKQRLADFTPPEACDDVADRLDGFVQSRSGADGAPPED